jgi:hypothetical protein
MVFRAGHNQARKDEFTPLTKKEVHSWKDEFESSLFAQGECLELHLHVTFTMQYEDVQYLGT